MSQAWELLCAQAEEFVLKESSNFFDTMLTPVMIKKKKDGSVFSHSTKMKMKYQ